jgi:putative CocE/NonD family hydrolase
MEDACMTSRSGAVAVERNLLVPLSDGVELAADLYRPDAAGRWPATLTFIPYHKDGRGGRLDVEAVNRYFAARGYAALTVDFRGLGSSSGVNRLPFDPQEARDGHEVVGWIAAQPWCDGNVGTRLTQGERR